MISLFVLSVEESLEQHRCAVLYDLYQKCMFQVAFSVLKNQADAEDVVNQVFLKMIEKHTLPDPEDKRSKAYLSRAAYNSALNLYNRNNHFDILDLDGIAEKVGFEPDIQSGAELKLAISKLPNKYKDLLIMYYYHGYSTKDIATRLEIEQKTVQKHLSRGRAMLKEMLQKE